MGNHRASILNSTYRVHDEQVEKLENRRGHDKFELVAVRCLNETPESLGATVFVPELQTRDGQDFTI